jgi:LmbE family N-acetylglucosaminyl deacetylase
VASPLRVLALSPHLDDAAFSAGATLATLSGRGHAVTLATVFTTSGEERSACMAGRREQDARAAERLGVCELVHLPFPEAPWRGYGSEAVMDGLDPRDDVAREMQEALLALGAFDLVLAPLGLRDHVDHRQLLRALGLPGAPGDAAPLARISLGPLGLWLETPHARRADDDPPTPGDDAVVVSTEALRRKLAACACYGSLVEGVFGGEETMRAELCGLALAEGGRHGRPGPAECFAPAGAVVRALGGPGYEAASQRPAPGPRRRAS